MKSLRLIAIVAAVCYMLLIPLSLTLGRKFREAILGEPVFAWEYHHSIRDNLPEGYEWVVDSAFACNVDDEGAWAYIADVCGDSMPEVILDYAIDGIVFANHQFLDIYSADGKVTFLRATDLLGIGFGWFRINDAVPVYGYGWVETSPQAIGFVCDGGEYVPKRSLWLVAWFWRVACTFAWQFSMPPEAGLVFVLMQMLFCFLVAYEERKSLGKGGPLILIVFGIKYGVLLVFESVYSIIGPFVPLFALAGPVLGLTLQTVVLSYPLNRISTWFS